jgi:hypothetical protein
MAAADMFQHLATEHISKIAWEYHVGSDRINVVKLGSAPLPFAWEDLIINRLLTVNGNL